MTAQVIVENRIVEIISLGEQGPVGPTGPQGPAGATVQTLSLEAGEDLAAGTPVWVSANKFYVANNTVNYRVVGVVTASVLTGFLATAVTAGVVDLVGLTPNSHYFLAGGTIASAPPVSGHVIRIGTSVGTTRLIVNIDDGVLLS